MSEQIIFADEGLITPAQFAALDPLEQHALRYGLKGSDEPHCFGSLQACMTRVAKLTSSGGPDDGSTNGYRTDALIELTVDPEIEEGVNLRVRNACGSICQTFRDCDKLVGLTFAMQLCHLDAELLAMLTGGSVIRDLSGAGVGNVIGFELPSSEDACPNGVSLEEWSKAWDNSAVATPAFAGGSTAVYFHWVFPKTQWQIGQLKFENDFMRVNVTGFALENPQITANGPFDDWPADVAAYGGITNLGGWFFDTTLPSAACGSVAVSSLAS